MASATCAPYQHQRAELAAADCQSEGHCFHRSTDLVHWELTDS